MNNPKYVSKPKLPDPPKRPKFRSLTNLKKALFSMPYFIAGETPEDESIESIRSAVQNEDNVAVLLRPLKLRDYIEFEKQFGEGIELFLYKIFHVIQATATNLSEQDPEKQVPIKMEGGIIQTPFGEMIGSLSTNIVNLCSFILSCGGRIIDVDDQGEYVTEIIDLDQIIDLLEPDAFFKMNQTEDFNPFYEILNISNVWNVDEVESELKDSGELTQEESVTIENFPQPTEGENSNDAPPKRRRKT